MNARIYKPAKNAMQSGRGNTKKWMLEFLTENSRAIEPIMGWTSNSDTKRQLKLGFKSLDEAKRYAEKHKISYTVIEPKSAKLIKQSYAENFL